MPVILISGSASGIGHAFLQYYAQDASNTIIAVDRTMTVRPDNALATIVVYQVNVSFQASINQFTQQIPHTAIDVVIHSIGVRGLVPEWENKHPDDVAKAETLDVMDVSTMLETYSINTVGTFSLIQALLPNLKLAVAKGRTPKVVVMGSRMGSVSYNTTGGAYAYRASKAALNAVMKTFSLDVPDVVFTTLHPGRVATGLVKTREEGAVDAAESVQDVLKVIDRLGLKDSGMFYDRFGEPIGW